MNIRRWLVPVAWITGVAAVLAVIVMNSPLSVLFHGAGANGSMYIWDLCAGQDDLWVVYPTDPFERKEFGIYSHGKEERGTETRPHIKGTPVWDPVGERFYAVSGKRLTVYETLTGNTIEYKLKRKYKSVSKTSDGDFILQQEDGDRYRFSPKTGRETKLKEEETAAQPRDGYELIYPSGRGAYYACYDHEEERELWRVEVKSLFPDYPRYSVNAIVAEDRVWLWAKRAYGLYAADMRTGEFTAVEPNWMLHVVQTEEGLLCFGRTEEGIGSNFSEVGIYMLHYDGTRTFLGGFRTPSSNLYSRFAPMEAVIFQGKAYYTFYLAKSGKVYCSDTIYDITEWDN